MTEETNFGPETLEMTVQSPVGEQKMKDWINTQTDESSEGEIPSVQIIGNTIPEVWERANLATWYHGCRLETQYDQKKDPPSRDCNIRMVIKKPQSEPKIHRSFPGSIENLEKYRQEVVEGIHDDWIDPESTKWPYTYHDRFFNYNILYPQKVLQPTNQIERMIELLAEVPYSRRIQAITWYPHFDLGSDDPPCLQRIWCRILDDTLNMHFDMRSWDAFKAALMNIFAFADLQRMIAEEVSEKIGRTIKIGPLIGNGDSFHIYGSYFKDPDMATSFQGFIESIINRPWEKRVFNSDEGSVKSMMEEERERIRREIEEDSD